MRGQSNGVTPVRGPVHRFLTYTLDGSNIPSDYAIILQTLYFYHKFRLGAFLLTTHAGLA
jgi:hypothetical protein